MKLRPFAAVLFGLALAHAGNGQAAVDADTKSKTSSHKTGSSRHVTAKAAAAPTTTATKAGSSRAVAARTTPRVRVTLSRRSRQSTVAAVAAARPPALRRALYHPPAPALDDGLGLDHHGLPALASASVLVTNQDTGEVVLEKNAGTVGPIASITKLMTAMVVLDGQPNLTDRLSVSDDDIDVLKGSSSRLPVGTDLSREEMLRLALMASENRAASALARHYPGGRAAFVAAMNHKAQALGLVDTRFYDSTGLNSNNVSSARDLTKMVAAAASYPLIREFSTTAEYEVPIFGRMRRFANTNALVRGGDWEIGVSKTGYISESGRCLVMQAWLMNKPMIIVLLDSLGKYTRVADAQRIRKWLEAAGAQRVAVLKATAS